jgi:hypothetical protein
MKQKNNYPMKHNSKVSIWHKLHDHDTWKKYQDNKKNILERVGHGKGKKSL